FSGRSLHGPAPQFVITSLTATPPGGSTAAQAVTATINGGQPIRGGRYVFTVFSGTLQDFRGIRDVAGNPLDGEFYGFFPSGNNVRGGDFSAQIDARHQIIFSPVPVPNGFATPVNPPGRPGSSFFIGNGGTTTAGTSRKTTTQKHAVPH